MSKGRLRIYELYGGPGGPISSRSVNYHGHLMLVAAVSIKQAYFFAANNLWADVLDYPAGIIELYQRGTDDPGGDHLLWCGCRIFGGLAIQHGSGTREIKRAVLAHACSKESK